MENKYLICTSDARGYAYESNAETSGELLKILLEREMFEFAIKRKGQYIVVAIATKHIVSVEPY